VEKKIRSLARNFLPPRIRKPLGSAVGWFYYGVVYFMGGVIFDCFIRRFRVDGCEFEIPRSITSTAYRGEFLKRGYEGEERGLVQKFVRSDDSVLEIGGCLGVVSCVTNKLLRDKTRHVVVEGNPYCIPAICRNREINQCGFLVEHCALSNQRELTFYLQPTSILSGSTQSLMSASGQRRSRTAVRVPGRTLEELDARYGPFSALVMDIEGAELEALEPAAAALKKYRVVIIELHEEAIGADKVELCREFLRRAGLQLGERVGNVEAWQRG
jgi:FkbM family methyltransferase